MYAATIIITAHDKATLDGLYRYLMGQLHAHPANPAVRSIAWCERAEGAALYARVRAIQHYWELEDRMLITPIGPQPADSGAAALAVRGSP